MMIDPLSNSHSTSSLPAIDPFSAVSLIWAACITNEEKRAPPPFTASLPQTSLNSIWEAARSLLGWSNPVERVAQAALGAGAAAAAAVQGLSAEELEAMRARVSLRRRDWATLTVPFVLRREVSGLARSLLVIPVGEGRVEVWALLKQKGGETLVGEGKFKKATWALNLDTQERKVFLSEKETEAISDREREALIRYAGRPEFSAGHVVRYRFKGRSEVKRGVLVDPCLQGSLADRVFEMSEIRSILPDIIRALAILHANNEIHLDVKPNNILLYRDQERLRAKLGDFSFIHKVGTLNTACGSAGFNAPELVAPGADLATIDRSADVWSLGMTLYDVTRGKYGQAARELGYTDERLAPSRDLSEWKERSLPERGVRGSLDWVIDQCLQINPRDRITMEALL